MRDRLDIAIQPTPPTRGSGIRLINVLLPGAGLVRLDHVLAGLAVGLLTWAPLTASAYVAWLSPGALPDWLVWTLLACGLIGYVISQTATDFLLAGLPRRGVMRQARVEPALAAAYEQFARGDLLAAQLQLDAALAADREHFEANLLQARLLALQSKFDQARRAYARCRRLDNAGRWRWEIDRELAALPS